MNIYPMNLIVIAIVTCVIASSDSQTSYAVDILRCVSIVDITVDWYMDVELETDDMLVLGMVYRVSLTRNLCEFKQIAYNIV